MTAKRSAKAAPAKAAKKQISARVEPELKDKISAAARKHGVSESDFIRIACLSAAEGSVPLDADSRRRADQIESMKFTPFIDGKRQRVFSASQLYAVASLKRGYKIELGNGNYINVSVPGH